MFDNNKKEGTPDYASFIRVYPKHPNQPDWIKAAILIDLEDFKKNFKSIEKKAKKDGTLILSVRESKGQKLYTIYDTFQRDKEVTGADHSPDREEDLPF